MIARYSRDEMAAVWREDAKFARWLRVELATAQIQVREGILPSRDGRLLMRKGKSLLEKKFSGPMASRSVKKIQKIEQDLRHDVLAFTTFCAGEIGPAGRFFHFGLTSTDVVDTAMAMAIQDAGQILLRTLDRVLTELKKLAARHQKLIGVGRTHGMHAEPTSFGLRFLGFHQEMFRNRQRLLQALERNRTGKLSGAVGANVHFSPALERKILKTLLLVREPVSTQTLPRDRLAELFGVIALIGASVERVATEIRHLSRSEVGEVREGFSRLQKGSSAMPHKRNPVGSENLTGCARLLRSYLVPALENVSLWHERDISHSSVERVILPDAFILADYSLDRLASLLGGLVVLEDRVRENLRATGGVPLSGHVLLGLVKAGAARELAYRWVQRASHQALDGEGEWVDLLFKEPRVKKFLSREQVLALLSERRILAATDAIYRDLKVDA